jgi:hypothetical protein
MWLAGVMFLRRPLSKSLRLEDGRVLSTLEDATNMLAALPPPEREKQRWKVADNMLQIAVKTGWADHAALATTLIERALDWPPHGPVRLAKTLDNNALDKKPPAESLGQRAARRAGRWRWALIGLRSASASIRTASASIRSAVGSAERLGFSPPRSRASSRPDA